MSRLCEAAKKGRRRGGLRRGGETHRSLARWETEEVATGERAETLRCSKTLGVASREAPGVVTRGHGRNHITVAKTFLSISTAAAVGPYGFQSRILKKFAKDR